MPIIFLGKENLKAIFVRIYVLEDLVGFSWLLSYWCCSLYFANIDIKLKTSVFIFLNYNKKDNVIKILSANKNYSIFRKVVSLKFRI